MAEPFLAEIRLFSFSFAPKGWALCNGQLLPINQNQALFSLLGTTYGGNGQTNFALPDLRGRAAAHFGDGLTLGQALGSEAVTLNVSQMPQHLHFVSAATSDGDVPTVAGAMLGAFNNAYRSGGTPATLVPSTVSNAGGSQPHTNFQPYLCINFIISLFGLFPSPT